MIIGRSLNTDHIIVHSRVVSKQFSPPNLGHSFSCKLSETVVVAYHSVEAEGLVIFDAFFDGEIRGQIPRSRPVELSLWAFPMEVTSDYRLDYLSEFVVNVEEGCALGAEGPFMEIAEISIRSNICDTEVNIPRGMCPINHKDSPFLFKELSQCLNWEGCACGRTDMIEHRHLYLLWVAVYEIFHFELEGL